MRMMRRNIDLPEVGELEEGNLLGSSFCTPYFPPKPTL